MYLVGDYASKLAAELGPEVCVVAETASKYNTYGDGGVTPWQDAIAVAQAQDPFEVGDLWLIGFSAGTQGVRTQLNAGCRPRYILACDGIHLPMGTPTAEQADSWKRAAASARDGSIVFSVSCSKTPAYDFKSTRQSAEELFGEKPCFGAPEYPCVVRDGEFRLYGATTLTLATDPKGEHMAQLRQVLPVMIRDAKSASVGGDWLWYAVGVVAGFIVGFFWLFVALQEFFAVHLEHAALPVRHRALEDRAHDEALADVLPQGAVA